METVTLGRTGLRVSVAGLGAGGHSQLGRRRGGSEAQAIAVIHAALDRGVTFIDTAAVYGTEPIVRAALAGRREKVVVSTKVKVTPEQKANAKGPVIDAATLRGRVESCLSNLGTDCIDILHLHGVRAAEYADSRERLVPELLALRSAGKIRFLGLTEKFDEDMTHVLLDEALRDDFWDVIMVGLNMVNQTALRRVLPAMAQRRIGALCMYAVRESFTSRDAARRLVARAVANGEVDAAAVDASDPLGFVLAESGAMSLTEAAYRFARHAPGIHVVLTGTGSVAHLEENIRAIQAPPLPPQVLSRLHALFGNVTSVSGDPLPP